MTEHAPTKATFGLGHLVALGGLGLCLIILVWQWIWALSVTKGAGNIISLILQFGLLGLMILTTALMVLMARKNAKLAALVYVMAGALFLLHYFSAVPGGAMAGTMAQAAGKAHRATLSFYFILGLITVVVGNRAASGCLTLPSSKDLKGVAGDLRQKDEPGSSEPEPASSEPEKKEAELGDVPLA